MKFKEMSCEELKNEFKKILDELSNEKLFKSLEKYIKCEHNEQKRKGNKV